MTTDSGVLRGKELAIELRKSRDELERQAREIEELNTQIKLHEESASGKDDVTKELYKELNYYKSIACLTDMTGSGITIEISDPTETVEMGTKLSIVDYPEFILRLISIVNSAGAEAIAINEQRISSYTEIERAQNHLEINGTSVNAPLTIHVLGEKDTLMSALTIKNGIVDLLRNYSYGVILTASDELTVPRVRHAAEFIYSKPSGNDESR
ncbi:MAG: DUF881 domain-containing protein [Tissierellia bacterium]|nr:DUF881 domain-containing protein [Tissierellia bacterium]